MPLATRISLIVLLMLAFAGGAFAQEAPVTETAETETTATATAATETTSTTPSGEKKADGQTETREIDIYELRNHFMGLIERQPGDLPMLLKLDPGLMTNEQFLLNYPELAKFLKANPEIVRNPQFYLSVYRHPSNHQTPLGNIIEALALSAAWVLSVFALGWLIRTIIEQKRWNKLSKTQAEVHNKILDRFGSSEELLEYVKSPAGTKFLESAPIAVRVERAASSQNVPGSRIIRSIQIGVIVAAAALGLLLVSLRFKGETSEALFAMGGIAFFLGAGFIASALVSIVLSRRFGLGPSPENIDDIGGMR
jgi:hypothetical protein